MEAETDSSKETTKTDQQIVKPLPKPKAVKPKPEKPKQTTLLKCGCAKTYISQSKLYNHVLERHSNLIVEIVKYESYKRTTSEYVRSRKSVNDKLVPILSKRKPNSAHINESSEHSSTDEEDQETETLLELVMEISKFLDQLREIDSLASALGPSKLAPVFRNGSFGPFKTFTDVEKPDSKNMLLENLTGQNRAKEQPELPKVVDKLYPAKIVGIFPSSLFQSEEDYLPLLDQLKTLRQGVIGERDNSTLAPYFICQPNSPHIESINITTLSCDQILAHFLAFLGSFMSDSDTELIQELIFVVCSIRFMLNSRGYQRRAEKIDLMISNLRSQDHERGSSSKSTNVTKTISAGSVQLDVQHEIDMLQREKHNTSLEYCTNPRCSIDIFIDLIQHFLSEVFPASFSRMIKIRPKYIGIDPHKVETLILFLKILLDWLFLNGFTDRKPHCRS